MPRPKGFEPFTYVWVLDVFYDIGQMVTSQAAIDFCNAHGIFLVPASHNQRRYFFDEQSYQDYKTFLQSNTTKKTFPLALLSSDIGKTKWFNSKFWIQNELLKS